LPPAQPPHVARARYFGKADLHTTRAEVDLWFAADAPKALELQRPLPEDALRIVASGEKEDGAPVLV
jgi:hypothetical protein